MADPYWRYSTSAAAAPERDTVPRSAFPGYLSSDTTFAQSQHSWNPNDLRGASSDYLQKDILPVRTGPTGAYGFEDITGIGSHSSQGLTGLTTGAGLKGLPVPLDDPTLISQRRVPLDDPTLISQRRVPLDDPTLICQRRDVALGISPEMLTERPSSMRKVDGPSAEESSILYVDGLPNDCTRREVAHLFRPFIGFKEIRVVHREPRRSGDKATVLCFVEFTDSKCALTAMEALQGYRFDDKKPDAPIMRMQFAQFPFRPPSSHESREERRTGEQQFPLRPPSSHESREERRTGELPVRR